MAKSKIKTSSSVAAVKMSAAALPEITNDAIVRAIKQDLTLGASPGDPTDPIPPSYDGSIAECVARAFSGDYSGLPSHIGFIFSTSRLGAPSYPSMSGGTVSINTLGAGIYVYLAPVIGGHGILSSTNSVEYHAVTQKSENADDYYKGNKPTSVGSNWYVGGAVLLDGDKNVIAWRSLTQSGYSRMIPDGYELSLTWKLTFGEE